MDQLMAGGSQLPTILSTGHSNGYGDNGGLLSTVLLASMLGRNGLGGIGTGTATDGVIANQSAELRRDVAKSESDIKESTLAAISRLQLENAVWFKDLDNRICDDNKDTIKAGYEARIESLTTKSDLLANQNANTISIKDDIKDFRFSVDKQFCETNSNIDKQFCSLEHKMEKGFERIIEREYKERIAQLEDKLNSVRYNDTQRELDSIKHDTNRAICALGKLAPTVTAANALSGCC